MVRECSSSGGATRVGTRHRRSRAQHGQDPTLPRVEARAGVRLAHRRRAVRRRQHRGGAGAGRRQRAELPPCVARRDRPAARHGSVRRHRLPHRGRAVCPHPPVHGRRTGAGAVLLCASDGRASADRPGGVLLGGRVRDRPGEEAREDAPRQGRRPHAPYRRVAGADGAGVPDLPGIGRGGRGRRSGGEVEAPVRPRGAGRGHAHAVEGDRRRPDGARRGVREAAGAVHRRRAPPRGERRENARSRAARSGQGRRGRGGLVPRGGFPRQLRRRCCRTTAWSRTWPA